MIRLGLVVLLKFLMAFLGLTEWGGSGIRHSVLMAAP